MPHNHKERKLNRLKDYDYSQDGYYFITICTKNKEHFFGDISNGEVSTNAIGKAVNLCWNDIPKHFPFVQLDEFIIMPNHIHGIIIINNVGNENLRSPSKISLSSIIKGFKIGVTKWCNKNDHEYFEWQKSFYDHIIRDEKSLDNIREYIRNNPLKWETDKNNDKNLYM